ncbi:MAG: hypothetical protein ACSLEN_14545 [Candidatus Malihini olakiniferum]
MWHTEGLLNYRHFHYERDTKREIGQILVKNRRLAAEQKTTLSDVLIVNTQIKEEIDTDSLLASVQHVIDLDKERKLINVKEEGVRGLTICCVSCHKRWSIVMLPKGCMRCKIGCYSCGMAMLMMWSSQPIAHAFMMLH